MSSISGSTIASLVEEQLSGTDKFLVDVLIKPGNKIYIFIDGDQGVSIEDCVKLSRFVESRYDRETEDYELNVSSAGADRPMTLPRQYGKNVGRSLLVKLQDETTVTGKLEAAGPSGIVLAISADKKKKIPAETRQIPFTDIIESKVIISFK